MSSTTFSGIKPYRIDVSSLTENANPLVELQKACIARGIADAQGYRITGAPWAFSLAQVKYGIPSVRTIGFQRISEHGLDWLTARRKDETTSPAGNNQNNNNNNSPDTFTSATTTTSQVVAISYTHGIYPPSPGESCEQWRAEGVPFELPVAQALATAPRASLAQILAVHQCRKLVRDEHAAISNDSTAFSKRTKLDDRPFFLAQVQRAREQLDKDQVDIEELQSAIQFVRLVPNRMELLANGEIWERFEWKRNLENGEWSERVQLMPY